MLIVRVIFCLYAEVLWKLAEGQKNSQRILLSLGTHSYAHLSKV